MPEQIRVASPRGLLEFIRAVADSLYNDATLHALSLEALERVGSMRLVVNFARLLQYFADRLYTSKLTEPWQKVAVQLVSKQSPYLDLFAVLHWLKLYG